MSDQSIKLLTATIKRLQTHAVPLEDTYDTVLNRVLDGYEAHRAGHTSVLTKAAEIQVTADALKIDPLRPPDFTAARIRGDFAGIQFDSWNSLLRIAVAETYRKVGSFDALRRITRAQVREGDYTKAGYKPIPGTNISLQGVEANRAWEYAVSLAKFLQVPIAAAVEWLNNPKAKHPGKRGVVHLEK